MKRNYYFHLINVTESIFNMVSSQLYKYMGKREVSNKIFIVMTLNVGIYSLPSSLLSVLSKFSMVTTHGLWEKNVLMYIIEVNMIIKTISDLRLEVNSCFQSRASLHDD